MSELRIIMHTPALTRAEKKDYFVSIKLSGDSEGIADLVTLLSKQVLPVSYDWTITSSGSNGLSTTNGNSIDDIAMYLALVAKHDAQVVDAVLEALGGDVQRVVGLFDDGFVGCFQHIEDVARHHINTHHYGTDKIYINQIYSKHMDLEALGRDLLTTDYTGVEQSGELYIFRKVNTMIEEIWASMGLGLD